MLLTLAPSMTVASSDCLRPGIRPQASAGVIAEARRRARRRRIVTTALLLAGVAAYFLGGHPGLGGTSEAARHSPTTREATACLVAQRALLANAQTGPQFLSAPAIHVSFPLVP